MVRLVRRARDRVAVRAGARVTEQRDDARLDLVVDDLLPAGGEAVDLPPLEADEVVEHARREPVTAHPPDGFGTTFLGQLQRVVACEGDAPGDEEGDRRVHLGPVSREPVAELVARGGEAGLVVLQQDLEDLSGEVVDARVPVRVERGDAGAGRHHHGPVPHVGPSSLAGRPRGASATKGTLTPHEVVRVERPDRDRRTDHRPGGTPMPTPVPALAVRGVSRCFGDVPALVDIDLDVPTGSFTSLLGPSGCGKTTLLRIVAGLERPDTGTVVLAGREVDGPGGHVPPEERRVGMVFQAHALFPHLDVARNVAFGLRGTDVPTRTARVAEVLALVGLTGLDGRMPSELSGGQQQRVALARALAPRPALLLLDEPFSSLDATLRASVREEVRAILQAAEQTALLVTHDQEEALSITDRVGVMFAGRLHQVADPATLYRSPATREVAAFVGDADLLRGTRAGQFLVDTPFGRLPTAVPVDTATVTVVVRPETVTLRTTDDGEAEVRRITFLGHDALIEVVGAAGITVRSRRGTGDLPVRGQRVSVRIDGPVVTFPDAPDGPS
jgi:iron(III) transport system ATP-binding protein